MRRSDIAVIGAGPAGTGAALAAARSGASVVLIDENVAPGGHLRWTPAQQEGFAVPLNGLRGFEIADWARDSLAAAGVELLLRSVAWGLFEDNVLGIASDRASIQLQAESVVVATGATDITWPFPGWELPGVMTATAALRLLHLDRVLPGRRVAVLGAGTIANNVAADLDACGAQIGLRVSTVDGLAAGGAGIVEWVEVDGQRTGCDTIVLAFGRQPDSQLVRQAHPALEYAPQSGVFVPSRGASLVTSLPGVYLIGDAAGIGSAARAFAEGAVAGEAASGGSGLKTAVGHLRAIDAEPESMPTLPAIEDATLVCRCEEVKAGVLRDAIAAGSVSLNDLKRRTRAGMGVCQGVYCHRTVAGMLATEAGVAIETIAPMTARPPARLISMAAMADLDV